ncbi:MAG: erythromycin esterase family protein [Chryseobacterium sp.]|jgi:erythromycin esterase|uniref:erythromycin esterase family protein n=1 Tax=Chryseobacterium sp. TaxID=1871047 RepID=UPI002825DEFC|nr:erythromycin esterase family protein [Chryseobacterium sp.]MDR2237270.1 erythromycin esterase family protein [Chryseobacterium sp.]
MRKYHYGFAFTLLMILLPFHHAQAQKKNLTEEEKTYLKKFIYPLTTVDPDSPEISDLKLLDQLVDDSKVVALGEVSHGSSEIYRMKDRMVRYLASHKDFRIFSLEASMPETFLMNEYTMNGKSDPKAVLEKMGFWIWQTEEMLAAINWIRQYNEKSSDKILFAGFDMLYTGGALDEIRKVCAANSFPQNDVNQLSEILQAIKEQSNRKDGKNEITSAQKETLADLLAHLKTSSLKIADEKEKNRFLQNLRIIEQNLDKSSVKRDFYMAQNIEWIRSQNPGAKMIVSAHNGHINTHKGKMGMYLRQDLKDDYTTFGFAFYSGHYTAYDRKSRTTGTFPAQTAYEGTAEYLLNSLDIPIFILDLKSLKKENQAAARWITGDKIKFRKAGSTVVPEEFAQTQIAEDFDYLIFIKESSHSKLLTP